MTTLDFSITPRSSDIKTGVVSPMGFQLLGVIYGLVTSQGQNFPQTNCCNTWHSFTLPTSRGESVSCLHLAYPRCASCQILNTAATQLRVWHHWRLPSGQIMRHISKLCKFLKFFFQLCFSNLPYSNYLRIYIIYPCPQTVLTKQSKHFVTHTKLKRNLYPKRSCW